MSAHQAELDAPESKRLISSWKAKLGKEKMNVMATPAKRCKLLQQLLSELAAQPDLTDVIEAFIADLSE